MKHEHLDQIVQFRRLAEEPQGAAPPRRGQARLFALATARPWFLAVVVLPTLLATLYYGLIASDLYVSEARFVVRSAAPPQAMNPLGSLLQSVGFYRSADDTFSVHDFILSRDMVAGLAARNDLKALLTRPEGDFVHRYPPLWGHATFEQLFESYKQLVSVEYDTATGISVLQVQAFRPKDANMLARAILAAGEGLINRMNDRARRDTVEAAQADVTRAEKRVAAAQGAVTQYRLRTRDLDPRASATASYALAGQLSLQLANAKAQLAQTLNVSPNSPQIAGLRNSVAALQGEVDRVNARIAGAGNSTTRQLSGYERLVLEQEFATKALASATASLESARQAAARQQLYLEEIVAPQQPDYPIRPRRLANILLVFIASLLLYGIAWLVSASVREHSGR